MPLSTLCPHTCSNPNLLGLFISLSVTTPVNSQSHVLHNLPILFVVLYTLVYFHNLLMSPDNKFCFIPKLFPLHSIIQMLGCSPLFSRPPGVVHDALFLIADYQWTMFTLSGQTSGAGNSVSYLLTKQLGIFFHQSYCSSFKGSFHLQY